MFGNGFHDVWIAPVIHCDKPEGCLHFSVMGSRANNCFLGLFYIVPMLEELHL